MLTGRGSCEGFAETCGNAVGLRSNDVTAAFKVGVEQRARLGAQVTAARRAAAKTHGRSTWICLDEASDSSTCSFLRDAQARECAGFSLLGNRLRLWQIAGWSRLLASRKGLRL